MSPLHTLLLAVARYLRRERGAAAARVAAWGAALAGVLATLLHLFVRPVSPAALAWCLALIAALAALHVFLSRATAADCAAWADRHLGGRSAYATALEVLIRPPGPLVPAVAHLEAFVAGAVPGSLEQLAERPFDAGLRKPSAAAAVCVALALVLLQLPTRARTPETTAAATPGVAPALFAPDGEATRPSASAAAATPARDTRTSSSSPSTARDAVPAAAAHADPRDATAAERAIRQPHAGAAAPASVAAARPAGTGLEAGEIADPGDGNAFTAPSQVELAARLREVVARAPDRELQADPSEDAEFTGAGADVTVDGPLAAAAAAPPPASVASPLAPAEQAYLRAYWSNRRTKP